MPICVLRSAVQLQNPSSSTRAMHAAWLAMDYLLVLGVIGRIDAGTYYIGFPPSVSANVRPMTATIICLRPGVTFKKKQNGFSYVSRCRAYSQPQEPPYDRKYDAVEG